MKTRKTNSSHFRHRLTLQQETKSPDGAGGYIRSWQNLVQLWGEIIPVTGSERLFSGKIEAKVSHRIVLRYYPGLNAAQRLVFDNRIFQIRAILNIDERKDTVELFVEEGVAG